MISWLIKCNGKCARGCDHTETLILNLSPPVIWAGGPAVNTTVSRTSQRMVMMIIITKTSINDEVICDVPTQCVMHRSMFVSARAPKSRAYKGVCPFLQGMALIRPAALWEVQASYFQHGKWHVKIAILKSARERERESGGGGWWAGSRLLTKLSCCHLVVQRCTELLWNLPWV